MTKEVHLYASQRVSRRAKDGKDGTSVTIISKSVTYQISASGTETPTGNWSDKVVATTDTKPYLWTRTIVVYSDTNSTTSYSVSYKGKDGAPGKDAYRVEVSPSTLVFDTNENGVVDGSALSGKYATVTVYKGSQKISADNLSLPSNYATKKYTNVDGRIYNTNGEARITITEIEQETISGDEKVSKSSGQISFPIDVFGERSTLMWVTVNVQVNVAKFTGSVVANNKKFETKFTEISDRFKNTPTNTDLTDAESRITQTAREISLSVSEKVIGRRNLLVNSAFRNQDSVFIHSLARIEKNTGVDGMNCIHSSDKYSGTGEGNYIGAFWNSTQKNSVTNIPIVKGKKYVISCWIKSDNLDLPFIIECLYMKSINQQSRDNVDGAISVAFKVHEKNKWEKISCVLDTNNKKATEYLAVNFWSNNKNVPKVTDATGAAYYPTCHAYICKPMMEEGDTYSGWTLSEDDYDYVGGNILDNTRSLEKSGNLKTEDSKIINEGYEYAYAVAHSNNTTSAYIEMLQWNMVGRINDGQDYMFSFLAEGKGVVSTYLFKDGTPRFFVESSNNKHDAVSPDGNVDFKLTNEWKRYWVHYHLNTSSEHPLPENLLIRCYSGNDVYVCQPKLEVGATMTEFTERKTDLVDKASLKKAGIEITTDKVKLYGDKVEVLTRKEGSTEYEEAGMFSNGKLNANLIDAKNVVTQGLRAGDIDAERATIKNLSIIGSSRNPFTRMSEDTNVDYSNNVSVITGSNGEFVTADYELKWDNSQNGRRITLLNYRWRNDFATGSAAINAPEGKFFFEDGVKKSVLRLSRQHVELLGIGDDIDFYGWIVVNKVDISTNFGYGHPAKVLAYGKLIAKEENNTLKLSLSQTTFDGKQITVESVGSIGYKFTFPSYWGNPGNFVPNIIPYQFIGHIYIQEIGEHYIIFRYSGKSSIDRNWEYASFFFSIQTASDFNFLN